MFDESEKWPFEVPPGRTKKDEIIKPVPDTPKLYVLKGGNSACILCSLPPVFYFVGDKIDADHLKDEISPSLKAEDSLKFAQNLAMNNLREKGKQWWKISYKVFK